jgi:hypothetical protein
MEDDDETSLILFKEPLYIYILISTHINVLFLFLCVGSLFGK